MTEGQKLLKRRKGETEEAHTERVLAAVRSGAIRRSDAEVPPPKKKVQIFLAEEKS